MRIEEVIAKTVRDSFTVAHPRSTITKSVYGCIGLLNGTYPAVVYRITWLSITIIFHRFVHEGIKGGPEVLTRFAQCVFYIVKHMIVKGDPLSQTEKCIFFDFFLFFNIKVYQGFL